MNGPAVILPKHQYWTDIPLVAMVFPCPLTFVAKKELFGIPGIRSLLQGVGGIPIDRERPIRTLASIRSVFSCLKASGKIVLFPEGTYVRDAVGPGKSRLIQMILDFQQELNVKIPFVPMGIFYGKRAGWRRRVTIRIGSPLFAEQESEAALLTRRVMEEISRLSGVPLFEKKGGSYAKT